MATPPHVAAITGSLREGSHTRRALRGALTGVEDAGATGELLDIVEYDLPVLNTDDDSTEGVEAFTAAVREADAVILGTPMYHGSYSGALKNALDHCGFDEFENKTVGLLAVSGGSFPITALDHLRSVCRALNAWVLPYQAAVPRSHSAFEGGEFVEEDTAERVRTLGRRTVQYADIEPDPACFESEQNVGATGDD
ncbi:NADPH-dependent FMN reductase [Halalkalicoccus jeotgali]|uniref:NADPH-dependent FMN reductase n=1 Tax=Halalkalicoccus jeotgali (strain DSM 18796 / CECT 7217 / JCM 14584 / KCTC 4019 / B3) TaxID=795797 RepID=D8J388_HALJB|nr:NAD(P)H-dependent oxidoreductase [Halalkalicoccus jeotgali]ADJ15195.1 NADPH-dependent FMN reductase [Halalkalicoccus jeotgali B3]ELY35228.1 NADPH-dependent FMN reductase [Halalkalicoccus jeotgali B3]